LGLITAFILAYLLKPLYIKLNKKMSKQLSAILCTLLILLIMLVFLTTIFGSIIQQVSSYLNSVQSIESILSNTIFEKVDMNLVTDKISGFIIDIITSTIPAISISILIIMFGIYYILLNWDALTKSLERYIPFSNKKEISKEIAKSTNSLIYGTLLVGIIEFVLAAIGFYFLNIPFYLVFAILIFLFAFIPGLGPIAIWVPLAFYYLFIEPDLVAAIGVIIIGLILSIFIDTIFRVKILGDKTRINPLIMLVGILGGVTLFGVFGFIIGPLILVYTIKLLEEAVKKN
jgi:predicted PurR-regulated permease PerM